MTNDERLKLVSSNDEATLDGRFFTTPEVIEDLKEALTQEIAFALLKWWFPNRLPTGDDYQKWVEISLKDAKAVTEHLVTMGIIKAEPNE
jgi:hypothetical protein